MSQKRFLVPVVTQFLMIMELAIVTTGITCGRGSVNCPAGATQICFYYKENEKLCYNNSSDICNGCSCTSQTIPCNTYSFAFGTCTTNDYIFCNNVYCNTSTGTEYHARCFSKRSTVNCEFCKMSPTMPTLTSFSPTHHEIINTSSLITSSSHASLSATSFIHHHLSSIGLTAISNNDPSLITGSLTKPSRILTQFISTSNVAQANIVISPVIAGVIPTVCILITSVFSLLVVLFIILYRKNKNKQMSVNQRGRASTLQQIDDIYYTHTLRNNHEAMDEGEAPDYSSITLENIGTNGARANTSNSTAAADAPYVEADYNTLVHMNRRQIMDNIQQDNNDDSTLSNNAGVATVTNRSAYEHVRDSHDPDYFDDLHVLQQIRAHKQ